MSEQITRCHQALVEAREARREQTWVQSRLAAATADRERAATRLEAARLRFQVEKSDVAVVEGSLLSALLRAFSSGRRAELRHEQAEMAEARLKLDEAEAEIAALDAEIAELDQRLAALGDADVRLSRAARAMDEAMRDRAGPMAEQLATLAEREGWLRAQRNEIDEALAAGTSADAGLGMIMDSLAQVRKVEIGTGFAQAATSSDAHSLAVESISQLMLARIRDQMGAVRHDVTRFQQECRDVAGESPMEGVALEPMPGVAEFILADLQGWYILEMIDDARWRVEKVRDQVQLAYAGMHYRRKQVEQRLIEAIEQKSALLAALEPDPAASQP